MRYRVPQFVTTEMKVVGPFTFQQFVFVGSASAICFFFYFVLAPKSFFLFLLFSILTIGGGLALAFGKYRGAPLPKVIINVIKYSISSRTYFWRKKAVVAQTFVIPDLPEPTPKKGPVSYRKAGGQLDTLSARVETKS